MKKLVEKKTGLYLREYVRDPHTGKFRQILAKCRGRSNKDIKDAERRLDAKVAALSAPTGFVSEIFEAYLAELRLTKKAHTILSAEGWIRAFRKIVGNPKTKNLSARMIREALLRSDLSAKTRNYYIRRWKTIFRWAYKNDFIDDISVVEKLSNFTEPAEPKESIAEKFLEKEELEALARSPEMPELYRLFTLWLALTGMRVGEAIGLDDKDVGDRYIHVCQNAQIRNGQAIGSPKTSTSDRYIYIRPELVGLIKNIRAYSIRQMLMLGNEATPYFFTNENGNRIDYDAYAKNLVKVSAICGHRITPHGLRHTFASLMFEAGMSYEEVQKILGHENSALTRRIYVHITEREKARTEAKMDKITLISSDYTMD